MKYFSLVCVFLCGLSLINAAPSCSIVEFTKCAEGAAGLKPGYPKTEEELDKVCSVSTPMVECLLEFVERCPNTEYGKMISVEMLKLQKETLKALCTKGSSVHTRYFDNIQCFSRVENVTMGCIDLVKPDFPLENINICQFGFALYGCALKTVSDTCGADATDLFRFLSKPNLAFSRELCCQDKQAKVGNIAPLFFF